MIVISGVVIFTVPFMNEKLNWGEMKIGGEHIRRDHEKFTRHKWENLKNQEI